MKGKIASWNDSKGYGFITPLDGGKQLFIHVSALGNRNRRPEINDVVTYSITKDKQGRPCAANATLAGDKIVRKAPRKNNKVVMVLALLFLSGVGVSVAKGVLPVNLLIGYLVLSLLTFIAYAIDKSAAKRGAWRTSESGLLMLGLAGGWPGGLFAQELLRHKSKKTSFRAAFWGTVFVNCGVLVWLHTEGGRAALPDFLL
jgi:uncharacterized membrane protein YsdA (DUF1294 family)/cold shock CspA family protein